MYLQRRFEVDESSTMRQSQGGLKGSSTGQPPLMPPYHAALYQDGSVCRPPYHEPTGHADVMPKDVATEAAEGHSGVEAIPDAGSALGSEAVRKEANEALQATAKAAQPPTIPADVHALCKEPHVEPSTKNVPLCRFAPPW